MSDKELDELLLQLKDACKKNRHHSSQETNINTILKKIDIFINRRQMKLIHRHKRVEDLQHDLLVSDCESSHNREVFEKKDFEVNQLHKMLHQAEQTTQELITKYDAEVCNLKQKLCTVQQEYERLKVTHKNNQSSKSTNETLTELVHLRELNQMLETDNRRLCNEIDRLIQMNNRQIPFTEKTNQLDNLINSLQDSNQLLLGQDKTIPTFKAKIKSLESELDFYKHRSDQQETDIRRLVTELENQRERHKNELEKFQKNIISHEIDQLRALLNESERQCSLLRLELQNLQAEREILQVRLIEEKAIEHRLSEIREADNNDYENFIRSELEINIDQANKLINYSNYHKKMLEEKIQELTNEVIRLKKENARNNVDDLSKQIYQCNENVLQAKREMHRLQMEIVDKNTNIYNLHRKIECLEQALALSKQRTNAQLLEIEDLRSINQLITSSAATERVYSGRRIKNDSHNSF